MTDLDGVKLAVTVKPLEWVSHLVLFEVMVARTASGGLYTCEPARGEEWRAVWYEVERRSIIVGDGGDREAAKAACQSDYEQRILSALSPTPEAQGAALGSGETEWIGDFLNRRTDVEKVLRDVKRGKRQALSPEECWELANRLSVPANHGGA